MSTFMNNWLLRRAMSAPRGGGGDGIEIPSVYQRVEYIQGNGSAYLDLGIKNKASFGIKYKIGGQFWCGADNGTGKCVGGGWMGGGDVHFMSGYVWNPIGFTPQTPFTISSNYKGSGECYVDDTYIRPFTGGGVSPFNFFLFGYSGYDGSRIYGNLPGPIHHFELTDGPDVIMDLYPCYRKSDGKPGMWDVVGWRFYENAGSGADFTVGPDVVQPAAKYIVFEDRAVEAICVANFSTDGIGVTMQDAAAVTDQVFWSSIPSSSSDVITFNEMRYFTGLTYIPGSAFYSWGRLSSVILPDGILTIGSTAFGNASLSYIEFPASVTNFQGGNVFKWFITVDVVFRGTTPPTFSDSGVFQNVTANIYVPYSADHSVLSAYQTALQGQQDATLTIIELNPDGTIPS